MDGRSSLSPRPCSPRWSCSPGCRRGRGAANVAVRPHQRRRGRRRARPAGLRLPVPGGLRPSCRRRPQPGRGAVRPVLVLAVAWSRGPPGAPRARAPLRRGGPHDPPHARPAGRPGGRPGRPACGRRPGRHRPGSPRAAAGPGHAPVGRGLRGDRVRRAMQPRDPGSDRGQRRRRRHRPQVHGPAPHGPASPADPAPGGPPRRRDPRPADLPDAPGAGPLPAGHVLQHGGGADV